MVMIRDKDSRTRDVFGVEEALASISLELIEPVDDKLYTLTDLTPQEIFLLSRLLMLANRFKSKMVIDWIRNFMLLRISLLRKGRQEILVLGTGLRQAGEEKRASLSLKSLLRG